MVCVPCIVVPLLLWVFHKYIYPYIEAYLPAWAKKKVTSDSVSEGVAKFTEDVLSTPEGKFIKGMVDKYPVILFSKTTCYYSKMAKKVLDEKNVNYFVEEIEQREDTGSIQDALLKITGERTEYEKTVRHIVVKQYARRKWLAHSGLIELKISSESGATGIFWWEMFRRGLGGAQPEHYWKT